ncbi:hypothetical protein F443_16626 [Phytophthora nicotianae P1569]|uniref:Uncharacterized protein n=1 Tax=Phytophthora nicotianae P1569 TaxID=1317065 RepID=V9EEK1_PHYNI|nr:hypothetical protein F443_16626 [Phytophthora nicotianae P1569]
MGEGTEQRARVELGATTAASSTQETTLERVTGNTQRGRVPPKGREHGIHVHANDERRVGPIRGDDEVDMQMQKTVLSGVRRGVERVRHDGQEPTTLQLIDDMIVDAQQRSRLVQRAK